MPKKNMVHRVFAFGLCIALMALTNPAGWSQKPTLIENVRVFDGESDIGIKDVFVSGGKIRQIGASVDVPEETNRVDGEGKTLLPGLIDGHVHVSNASDLDQTVLFGVTTVFDMMGNPEFARVIRREQESGKANDRADAFAAGIGVTIKGGHGTQYHPVPSLESAEKAQEFIDARLAEGSDYIKIIYGGAPVMTKEMLQASIDATHRRGKMAFAHIDTVTQAVEAIECGIDGLVHLCGDREFDEAEITKAKVSGVFVVPTTVVLYGNSDATATETLLQDQNFLPLLTPSNIDRLRMCMGFSKKRMDFEILSKNIRDLHEAGVPILTGSDAPNPSTMHGGSVHHEIELLVDCGLPPAEALAAATSKIADGFRLADRGRIRRGLRADLLLVDGNPLEDVKATRRIAGVWKEGHWIDRESLIGQIKSERDDHEKTLADEERMISDFEDGLTSRFGSGWSGRSDQSSSVEISLVKDGAIETRQSLLVKGNVAEENENSFAGALFLPGSGKFLPADLSAHNEISFWVKGDSQEYSLFLFAANIASNPAGKTFKANEEWEKVTFSVSDFGGCDGKVVFGLAFGKSTPGQFQLQLDQVKLMK